MHLRLATLSDRDAIWDIFHEVIATGDTYVFDPAMPREEALAYWFQPGTYTWVAEVDGKIVGTWIFKANQPGLGSHVANASFMVSSAARGLGVGKRMGSGWARTVWKRRGGWVSGRCSSTLWSPPMRWRCGFGNSSDLKSSAPFRSLPTFAARLRGRAHHVPPVVIRDVIH